MFGGEQGGRMDKPGNDVAHFRALLGRAAEWEELPAAEFGMWLPAPDDSDFGKSPVVAVWTDIYAVTVGCWSFVTADLLKVLGIVSSTAMRLGLPEENQSFPFFTNTDVPVILSLSQEKGIRFHFTQTTPLTYRMTFLQMFLAYCRSLRDSVQRTKSLHENALGFEEWWILTVQTGRMVSAQKPLTGIGMIKR